MGPRPNLGVNLYPFGVLTAPQPGRRRGSVPDSESGQIGEGRGRGGVPAPGQIRDEGPVPVPGQVGDGDGEGSRHWQRPGPGPASLRGRQAGPGPGALACLLQCFKFVTVVAPACTGTRSRARWLGYQLEPQLTTRFQTKPPRGPGAQACPRAQQTAAHATGRKRTDSGKPGCQCQCAQL